MTFKIKEVPNEGMRDYQSYKKGLSTQMCTQFCTKFAVHNVSDSRQFSVNVSSDLKEK